MHLYAKPEGRVSDNCNGLPSEWSVETIQLSIYIYLPPSLFDCPTDSSGEAALDIATADIPEINGVPAVIASLCYWKRSAVLALLLLL